MDIIDVVPNKAIVSSQEISQEVEKEPLEFAKDSNMEKGGVNFVDTFNEFINESERLFIYLFCLFLCLKKSKMPWMLIMSLKKKKQ